MPSAAPCGIVCVSCGSRVLRVIDTRAKDNCVYRRRECKDCGAKFSTAEEPVEQSGSGMPFRTKSEDMRDAVAGFMEAFTKMMTIANGGSPRKEPSHE
jgi:transcriptional regulator NrdR family protein